MNVAVARRPRAWELERVGFAAGAAAAGALAAAACLPGALRDALWQDEVASARVVSQPHPAAMLAQVAHTESTPPLWYALAWLLHRCGVGIVDLRLLSVAAAALLASATAVAARRVVPAAAALLAAVAVALGYQFDFHGRELRAYELAALLAVALAVAATRGGTILAAVVAAGSLTHYFFLFSVLAVLLWRPRLWRPIAVGLVPLALWSPFLLRQYGQHRFSFIGRFDLHAVAATYWLTFARGEPDLALPLLLLAAVVAGTAVLARRSDEGRLWALLATAPVATAALLWLAGVRVYDVRNLIVAGPFAAVAVASLFVRRAALPVACALVAVIAAGWIRSNRVTPVPYDRIAAALVSEGWRVGEPIAVYGDVDALWGPLEWYLPHRPTLVPDDAARPRFVVVVVGGARLPAIARRASALQWVRRTLVARVDGRARLAGAHTLVAGASR